MLVQVCVSSGARRGIVFVLAHVTSRVRNLLFVEHFLLAVHAVPNASLTTNFGVQGADTKYKQC